jgi:hypothetical protein
LAKQGLAWNMRLGLLKWTINAPGDELNFVQKGARPHLYLNLIKMKNIAIGISILSVFCLFAFQTNECANVSAANKKIVAYVKTKMGKTLPEDYCFSLVEYSYKAAGLEFHHYSLGKKTNYKTECVFPGDIIGFGTDVKYDYVKNDTTWTMSFTTEQIYVIYKIKGKGDYVLAEQDVWGKKRVRVFNFNMTQVKKGKPSIYRPGT